MRKPHEGYLEQLFMRLGAQRVGRVACALEDGPVDPDSAPAREAPELGGRLVAAITAKEEFPEQLREIDSRRRYCREVIGKRGEHWPWEYR